MLSDPISRTKRRAENGSALVIVLFFIVLLSVVTIAFLTRSMTAAKVSAGSAGETKSKILAASAGDIVIGDLKQEIIAGSSSVGTVNYPVYTPNSNLTMIPFQNGVPASTTAANGTPVFPIPNLIKRSVSPSNTGGAAPAVTYTASYTAASVPPNRAAQDATANGVYTSSKVNSATPSLNGRYVSPAQWNAHYLIPRATPANPSTTTDATPVSTFVPPDWVIVTRSGAISQPWSNTAGTGLTDPVLSNTNYAIGRFAYAVYNEGGLLDMNAAGYPGDPSLSTTTTPPFFSGTPNGLAPTQSGKKSSLALADLTQLAVGGTSLTQAQVNSIVGWRNYASAQPPALGGTYPNFTFTSTTASNWLNNFVLGNTNGYMQVVPPPTGVTTPPTDQAFLSRQQLISVIQSLSISPDFLQYMGTFSRALEQPSTVPNPSRPKILTGQAPPTASPIGTLPDENSYIGNNDGMGGDTDPTGINPSFLSIRATSAFTRWNGTTAVVGEPLVKTKFALSWLAMVAYNAINTSLPTGFAKTTGDPNPILDRFGLTRSSASSPWVYNHGQTYILPLFSSTGPSVQSQGREPDFAELLKAAIIAGSLAKAGPNLNVPGNNNYQYTLDYSLDLNVIQIMANLIDQQDTDSYPTVIQINGRTIYGVEDLPYFYRYHLFSVVDKAPGTALSNSANRIVFVDPAGTTTTGSVTTALDYTNTSATPTFTSWTFSVPGTAPATVYAMAPGTVTSSNAGEATFFYVPELWNPHDPNTLASETSALRPSNFRIYAVTDDPLSTPPTGQWHIGAESQLNGTGNATANATSTVLVQTKFQVVIPETGSNDVSPNSNLYHWPISDPQPFTAPTSFNSTGNNIMYFSDGGSTQSTMGTLFREPTLLWNSNPTGISLLPTTSPNVTDANTSKTYYGIIAGKAPVQVQVNFTSMPPISTATAPGTNIDQSYIIQGNALNDLEETPAGTYAQISFFLQYQDPNNSSNWITYDVKYPDLHGLTSPNLVVNTSTDYPNYTNILSTNQFPAHATTFDPRTARWGIGTASSLGEISPGTHGNSTGTTSYLLQPTAYSTYNSATLAPFSVMETDRARGDKGNQVNYSNPGMTSNPGQNAQMHWFSGVGYSASNGQTGSPLQFNGLFSENNPAILFNSRGETAGSQLYVEDADGVARLAMGGYASTSLNDSLGSPSSLAQSPSTDPLRIGLPEATASTVADTTAIATATAQTQSRPIILNRLFRSVSEMSYAFRGTPWKNIDFFTPASGDSALLDTFCLNEPPPNAMIAGKVDLNTRQVPVLQAIVAGAYRDEVNNSSASPPSYALPPLSSAEANNVATTLQEITSDFSHGWRGPLLNISNLVGRYVSTPASTTDTDFYTYTPASADTTHGQQTSMSYAGLTAALNCSSFFGTANYNVYSNTMNSANASAPYIQRFREAGIRPLVDSGQVRVWNLLLDVVAQTGRYPKAATGFSQFVVDGQTHLWVHVAIDRYTGQVIDKQVEVVTP